MLKGCICYKTVTDLASTDVFSLISICTLLCLSDKKQVKHKFHGSGIGFINFFQPQYLSRPTRYTSLKSVYISKRKG